MYSIQENNFINVPQEQIIKALKKYLEVRNQSIKGVFDNKSNSYLDNGGICTGLSSLWAFSQRQEERNTEDNDLYTISKLRILFNGLNKWYEAGANSNEIDWYEKDKDRDKNLIKSEDIEILLSTINILQNPPEGFTEIKSAIKLDTLSVAGKIFNLKFL